MTIKHRVAGELSFCQNILNVVDQKLCCFYRRLSFGIGYVALYGYSDFFDVGGVDVDGGAAEEGEGDEERVRAVGVGADFALEAAEAASDDADTVTAVIVLTYKFDRSLGVSEHEFQRADFGVCDDGYRFVEAAAVSCAVDQEAVDAA